MTHDHEHDDRHDRGLGFDLQTLLARQAEPPRFERRGALKLLAGAGAGLALVACGGNDTASTTTTGADATTTTAAAGATSTTAGSSGSAVEVIPEETGGPYPGDGSNGPNVLTESGVVRSDITSSFGSYAGTAEGVANAVELTIVTASTGVPLAGAAVYLWHCTRDGGYSLYSQGITEQNFLRGVQAADANGVLTFQSIFPGAYDGRWPHLHFEVFESLDAAASGGTHLVTSQLALPAAACQEVYATSGYEQSLTNLGGSSLETDMVFSDGYDLELATVTGSASAGYVSQLTIGV
jgi:protocatechuate 3,4-dioxygenase beta subunit